MSSALAAAGDLPEQPAIPPDAVATIARRPVHGHVSGRRSTHDGRVRLDGTGDGTHRVHTSQIELFTDALANDKLFSDGRRLRVDPAAFHASTAANLEAGHVALCDPYLAAGTDKNPYVCVHTGKPADCYDVSVLQIVHAPAFDADGRGSELWSTPVTITVTEPKSDQAEVAKLTLRGSPVRSPIQRPPKKTGEILLEPVISGDGRLLFLNSGSNLLYSVMAAGAPPCDARGWKKLDHISAMHRDPAMSRYEIARYPIRDSENRKVRSGRAIRGAYPWIDRDGRNLFFTQVSGTGLFYEDRAGVIRSRFGVLNPLSDQRIELGGPTRFGLSYFGLWSQGKMIIPDTRANSVDFSLGRTDYRARIELYSDGPSAVRVGEGTITKINSPENQWNYRDALRQRSPRDVVWWLSANNDMTGEVVFDDVLDLGSLIFSPMNATVNNRKRKWRDGFDYGKKAAGYVKAARIQNEAASEVRWKLPSFGRLFGARVEPIAAGGIKGKGLWLDGEAARVEYTVPTQPSGPMLDAIWSTSVWFDPRGLDRRRRLLTFPDQSWVDVTASGLILGASSGAESSVAFPGSLAPRAKGWTNIAFLSHPTGADVFLQGFRLTSIGGAFLRVEPGKIVLGGSADASTPGFRGWVDELRVASGARDPETICNWAHGTLRGLDPTDDATDFAAAGSYPESSHQEISNRLTAARRPTSARYLCERQRDQQPSCLELIHRPGGSDPRCVRSALLFPEGPIHHDRPRPDSSANPFCQSCHTRGHATPTLRTVQPLTAGAAGTLLSEDDRRQPSQAPRVLHGYIPKALLGLAHDVEAPPEGLALDPLLYPAADGSESDQF